MSKFLNLTLGLLSGFMAAFVVYLSFKPEITVSAEGWDKVDLIAIMVFWLVGYTAYRLENLLTKMDEVHKDLIEK